jgi:hypothetical protein
MRKNKSLKGLDEQFIQIDYITKKLEFVKEKIPDVQAKPYGDLISLNPKFVSASVNQTYTGIEFRKSYDTLYVSPYLLLDFTYNGKTEIIRIHSSPGSSRLAYVSRYHTKDINGNFKTIERQINFSKIQVNFKNNNFNIDMLNDCRIKILEFIDKYPSYKINAKHLDEKIKKLMAFR